MAFQFCVFHLLDLFFFILPHGRITFLLTFHFGKFFLLKHLHASDFKCFTAEHGQNWLDFVFEQEEFIIFCQGFFRNSLDNWHLVRHCTGLQSEFRLTGNFIAGRLVSQLGHKLVRLYVDVLLAWRRLGRLDVAREKFLRGFRPLLLEALRVVLALVRLEELVGVGARRDHHRRVRAAPEHSLVEGDILGHVLFLIRTTVGVLVLRLVVHNERFRSETLPTCS